MGVTITKRGKQPKWNAKRAAAIVKAFVPGAIIERTNAGIDMHGRAFAGYSSSWRETLALGGEDPKVDLRLTGGLLNSIKARETILTETTATVITAPDTGTSPAVSPKNGRMKRAGKRGPPHNVLAGYIHDGTARMPPRPFLGLAKDEEKELGGLLLDASLWE